MTNPARQHAGGRGTLHLLWSALESWFLSVVGGFVLIVTRQNVFPPPADLATLRALDGVTMAVVVVATAVMYLRVSHDSLSRLESLSVGILWVGLSLLGEHLYRVWIHDRDAMRFLLELFLGGSSPDHGWVRSMFLVLQLCALLGLKLLREGFSRHWAQRLARHP